ncbi:uncharacterized protein LOC132699134 isoform X2 [Cylas formicarius]|uniref:uncharacterized protein LOC132699134 isoform X2 n=1 Tax=Cylas formicarius TaxID=197179 RepID=UPI0029583909|nr:uncharacterized protein LOC132699134 isoform X2 [Cylas formicarius]
MNSSKSVNKVQTRRKPLSDISNFIAKTIENKDKHSKKGKCKQRFGNKNRLTTKFGDSAPGFVLKQLQVSLNRVPEISQNKAPFISKELKVNINRLLGTYEINDTQPDLHISKFKGKGSTRKELAGITGASESIAVPKGTNKKKKRTINVTRKKTLEAVRTKCIVPPQFSKSTVKSECDDVVFSVSVDPEDSDNEVIFNFSGDSFEKVKANISIVIPDSNNTDEDQEVQETVKNLSELVDVPVRINKIFRKLPRKSYAEETHNSKSESLTEPIRNALPVYRQMLPETEKLTNDEYEFNDFSPDTRIGKRRKPKRSSYFFEKEIHEVVKNLEKKDLLQKRKAQREVIRKITKQKKCIAKNEKSYDGKMKKLITNLVQKVKNQEKHKEFKITSEDRDQAVGQKIITTAKVHYTGSRQETKENGNSGQRVSGLIFSPCNKNDVNSTHDVDISDHNDAHEEEDIGSCFGFDKDCQITTERCPQNKVNIISNVIVNSRKSTDSSGSFSNQPIANSTMLPEHCVKQPGSPWRFDLNVKVNPHFLRIKQNALPQLQQDIIINHSLAKEFEQSCAKTPNKGPKALSNSPIQQSILNYIENNLDKENTPLKNSLYDYNQFVSPIKNQTKPIERRQAYKKNILTTKNDNLMNLKGSDSEDITNITYFGFNETADEVLNEESTSKDPSAKPSRFDMSAIKKYPPKKKKLMKNDIIKDAAVLSKNLEEIPQEHIEDSNNYEVHLFEDPEEILDSMPPEIGKRQKRKRIDSETNDERKEQKRHRKTKFEIEQENWIETFNKEIEETEKCQLEYD